MMKVERRGRTRYTEEDKERIVTAYMTETDTPVVKLCERFGVSPASLYAFIREYEEKQASVGE